MRPFCVLSVGKLSKLRALTVIFGGAKPFYSRFFASCAVLLWVPRQLRLRVFGDGGFGGCLQSFVQLASEMTTA